MKKTATRQKSAREREKALDAIKVAKVYPRDLFHPEPPDVPAETGDKPPEKVSRLHKSLLSNHSLNHSYKE